MKRWWWLPAVANGAYALWWFVRAGARAPLWYDELFTVRLSAISGVRALWHALAAGFDFNPPGLYLVTRLARLAPVADPLAARLPALFGCALLMATLLVFLRRRVGPALAIAVVALLPLSNFVERYAIEARAYMLLLGVSGCALVCWQSIGGSSPRRRIGAAAGVTTAVAVALTLHVWSIVLPAALLAGEATIAMRTRRIRWMAIASLGAAAPLLAMYPPLLRATETVSFANVVYAPSAAKLLSAMLIAIPRLRAVALVALVTVLARLVSRMPRHDGSTGIRVDGLLPEEQVVLAMLALSPLVPYGYAVATDGAFMARYALFAVIGVTGLLAHAIFTVARPSPLARAAAAVAASVLLWAYLPARAWVSPDAEVPSLQVLRDRASRDQIGGTPVVLVNPLDVLAVDERATAPEQRMLTFVADPAAARRYTGADLVDVAYLRGETYLHMHIPRTTYEDLTRSATRLCLLGEWQPLTWIPQKLSADGWTMTRLGGTDAAPLFEARRDR